jgi:hypothetical protein
LQKYAEAELLYRRALTALDSPYSQKSEKLADVLSEYSEVLRELKRPTDASKIDSRLKGLAAKEAKATRKQ